MKMKMIGLVMIASGAPLLMAVFFIHLAANLLEKNRLTKLGASASATAVITGVERVRQTSSRKKQMGNRKIDTYYYTWDVAEDVTYIRDGSPVTFRRTRPDGEETDRVGDTRVFTLYYDPGNPDYNSLLLGENLSEARKPAWLSLISRLLAYGSFIIPGIGVIAAIIGYKLKR